MTDHLGRLRAALAPRLSVTQRLRDLTCIDDTLEVVRKRLDAVPTRPVTTQEISAAIETYAASESFASFRSLRTVCFGLSVPARVPGGTVLGNDGLTARVLSDAERYGKNPHQFRMIFFALMASYLETDPRAALQLGAVPANWNRVREFLGVHVKTLVQGEHDPDWAVTTAANANLFSASPCAPYIMNDGRVDRATVDRVVELLKMQDSSWFSRELLLAEVAGVCRLPDALLTERLGDVLDRVRASESVRDEGFDLLLERYARVAQAPIHAGLRDLAVQHRGSPWLPSTAAAWGRVSPNARTMVANWLKLEFIESFFTLLSEDSSSDTRRLKFWSQYIDSIETIRIALGSDAMNSNRPDFVALNKKIRDVRSELIEAPASSNAFILRMRGYTIVEFSASGNALYAYDADRSLPFDVGQPLRVRMNDVNSLKHDSKILKLSHKDGVHGWSTWEERFHATLRDQCGVLPGREKPTQSRARAEGQNAVPKNGNAEDQASRQRRQEAAQPAASSPTIPPFSENAFAGFAKAFNLTVDDMRSRGGNLWVRHKGLPDNVVQVLEAWGFSYRVTRGWWR